MTEQLLAEIQVLNEILEQNKQDIELLNWLISKMYVAGGLIELKVCPLNNPMIPKYHNGYETHDENFNKYIGRINELKARVKNGKNN